MNGTSGRTRASEQENERAGRFLMARTFAPRGATRNACEASAIWPGRPLARMAETAGTALRVGQVLDLDQRRPRDRGDDELSNSIARCDGVRLAPQVDQ